MAQNKIVFRMQKIKSAISLRHSLMHAMREQNTPNADPNKLKDNQTFRFKNGELVGSNTVADCMNNYHNKLPKKIRKNAVHCLEFVVSGSHEQMMKMTEKERYKFFSESALHIAKKCGGTKNIIHAQIHNDEKTPHLTLFIVPIDDKGKLNARKFVGGTKDVMRKWQTEIAEVGKKYGLERGYAKVKTDKYTTLRQFTTFIDKMENLLKSSNNISDSLADDVAKELYEIKHWEENKSEQAKLSRILLSLRAKNIFSDKTDEIDEIKLKKALADERIANADVILSDYVEAVAESNPKKRIDYLTCFLEVLKPRLEMDNEQGKQRRKRELEEIEKQKRELSDELLRKEKALNDAVRREREKLKERYDLHNKSELERYKSDLRDAHIREYTKLENKYNDLVERFNDLATRSNQYILKNDDLKAENQRLNAENERLQAESIKLNRSIDEMNEYKTLYKELREKWDNKQDLQEQMNRLIELDNRKNNNILSSNPYRIRR